MDDDRSHALDAITKKEIFKTIGYTTRMLTLASTRKIRASEQSCDFYIAFKSMKSCRTFHNL